MNLGSEAREGLEQLREAKVIETSEPLGFFAAQRGDTGDERVRDELLHRLYTLGHRRAPGSGGARPPAHSSEANPAAAAATAAARRPAPAGRGPALKP